MTLAAMSFGLGIVASLREVGVIEPLIVHREKDGAYLLLDGTPASKPSRRSMFTR